MQQPNLNSTPAHRPPDYTIASNCHTHDAQPPALQKNPPTGPKSTNPTATNDQQRNANNTTPESPDSEGCPPSGKSSRTAATQSLSAQRMTTTTTQHHTTPYSRAYRYTSFLNTHDTRVLPLSIWHHRIRYSHHQVHYSPQWGRPTTHLRSHLLQFLSDGTKSTQNSSREIPHSDVTSTKEPTALLPDLLIWYQNLAPIIYYIRDAGRPGPPWPPPTKFLRVPTPTANTDLSTDPTATRPSRAWQPTDLLTSETLRAIALFTCQYHHIHLSRQPKLLWYTPKRVTTTTPTTADKNLLRPP